MSVHVSLPSVGVAVVFVDRVGAVVGLAVGGVGAGASTVGLSVGGGGGGGGGSAALSVEQQFANVVAPYQQAALPPAPCVAVSQHDKHADGRVATFQPYRLLLYPAQIGTYWLPLAALWFQHVLAEPLAMRSAYTGFPGHTLTPASVTASGPGASPPVPVPAVGTPPVGVGPVVASPPVAVPGSSSAEAPN